MSDTEAPAALAPPTADQLLPCYTYEHHPLLKNAMFLSAFASLTSPDSRAFYDRKRAEGKKHNAAIICLARRRCDIIIAMVTTGQPYELRIPKHLQEAA